MTDTPVIERADGRWRVCGPVTLASVESLLAQGKQALNGNELTFDLSGVSEADSSAVALMLAWSREASARGASICFQNLPQNLRTLVSVYDVGELLPCV